MVIHQGIRPAGVVETREEFLEKGARFFVKPAAFELQRQLDGGVVVAGKDTPHRVEVSQHKLRRQIQRVDSKALSGIVEGFLFPAQIQEQPGL